MSLDGTVYSVRLVEMSLQEITFDSNEQVVWPQSIGDHALPIVDGVLVLHDATFPRSIKECSRILGECYQIPGTYVVVSWIVSFQFLLHPGNRYVELSRLPI